MLLKKALTHGLASALLLGSVLAEAGAGSPDPPFTVEQIRSYAFPTQLTAARTGARLAWTFNEKGARNVWVAEAPDFVARPVTSYTLDDGQEILELSIADDGRHMVYVRGAYTGVPDPAPVNAMGMPEPPKVQISAVPFEGGAAQLLGEGTDPVISPGNDRVAFVKDRQIWIVPIDGSTAAKRIVAVRGQSGSPQWSPDGTRIAFVCNRVSHAFVGIYTNEKTPIRWLAPAAANDGSPTWSPDGKHLAFVRRPGTGGPPLSAVGEVPRPWAIWAADASTGEGREVWKAPATPRGSFPARAAGADLRWATRERIVFVSYGDGWPHLYSIMATGGEPLLLTPGHFAVEYVSLSRDGRLLSFAGNTGPDADDIDRRHILQVPVDRAEVKVLTPGKGLEWAPVVTGDGRYLAFLASTSQRPPLPMVMPLAGGTLPRALAADRLPSDFPSSRLVVPEKVVFRAADGVKIHGQLFEGAASVTKKPAVVYVHGGPAAQALLGWPPFDWAYSINQVLASRGFVVLSVNFRRGSGYGHDFQYPARGGPRGAEEYQDVKAAAAWLSAQPHVDATRIGIYGGSYGGYLTALALARDSALFAAGVDICGIHDWTAMMPRLFPQERYESTPDLASARELAWTSSPMSAIATWRSPVLLVHADDDRNVPFSQTVDLIRRLAAAGIPYEELVIPDDTHHFVRHASQLRVNAAVVDFLERKLVRSAGQAR